MEKLTQSENNINEKTNSTEHYYTGNKFARPDTYSVPTSIMVC